MAGFEWTAKKAACALMLAEGHTNKHVAETEGVHERTLYKWQTAPEFKEEIDRLSVMVGIASCAGRMRLAHRAIRQRATAETIDTDKDILDWLKFAQSETDGIKSKLASSLLELVASVAERSSGASGQGSSDSEK